MTDFFPIVVTALAALVQGCLGFGAGLLSMAILSLVWEVRDATVIMAPVGWLMVASLVVKLRKDTTPRALIPIFTAIPIGVFGGIYALDVLPGVLLKSLLGLTLLAFVGHSLRKTTSRPHRDSQRFATAAGALSGFTGAALSAAGPPVLIYATVAGWEKDRFRANLQAIFFVVSTISVIGLTVGDFFSESSILLSLKLIPGVLAGAMIGTKISAKIPQEDFRKIVFAALATMGLYFSLMPLW
ncbi:MAG: sulfite exporter TauE/SafE family protein [Myxococcota bacterium]|nr:sulfite exporter TauE/SafE family protein [Myxococcota bacterium]